MRVVIDTNVLVSAALNPHGSPARIVDAVLAGSLTLLHDDRVLSEYREVLLRPVFAFSPERVQALLDFLTVRGEHVSGKEIGVVLPDPDDLPFLQVAVAGLAEALITGNIRHYRPIRGKHRVRVLTPVEFLPSIV